MGRAVELRTNFDGVCHGGCFGNKLVVNGLLNKQAAASAAALAVVQEEANMSGHDGGVEVCVLENDQGGLAAEFESDLR